MEQTSRESRREEDTQRRGRIILPQSQWNQIFLRIQGKDLKRCQIHFVPLVRHSFLSKNILLIIFAINSWAFFWSWLVPRLIREESGIPFYLSASITPRVTRLKLSSPVSQKKTKVLVSVWIFATPCTVAHQALLSIEFYRQEYWGRLSFPSPRDLPKPGIEPRSPALQADSLPSEPPGNHKRMRLKFFQNPIRRICY